MKRENWKKTEKVFGFSNYRQPPFPLHYIKTNFNSNSTLIESVTVKINSGLESSSVTVNQFVVRTGLDP